MVTFAAAASQSRPASRVDLAAADTRQRGAWASGDYAVGNGNVVIILH
jgi:hypothetical protein